MKEQALAKLYYREVRLIANNEDWSIDEKIEALYHLLHKLFIDITQNEYVHFTTIFARIAFASHKYKIDSDTQFYTYLFRKNAVQKSKKKATLREKDYLLGLKVVCATIHFFYHEAPDDALKSLLPDDGFYPINPSVIKERIPKLRVVAIQDVPEQEYFLAKAEEYADRLLKIRYNDRRNENFMPTIKTIRSIIGFPVTLNLLEIVVEGDEILSPRAFVIEPDYLLDVTAVAECFKENNNTEPLTFLLSRFLPKETTVHILLGNVANYFLDELIVNPELTFDDLFPKSFKISPFAYAMMNDQEIRDVMAMAKVHFIYIKRIIKERFESDDLHRKNCFLEPSFYSETYGLQGRLDVLHIHPDDPTKAAIIELKSGKPFRPNGYKVNHSHYTQTLLYDLMIQSAYDGKVEPQNYILYSQVENENLRYAPAVKAQQYEAINQRNQLIGIEQALILSPTHLPNATAHTLNDGVIFKKLKSSHFENAGFFKRDVEKFESIFTAMNDLQKAYFYAFSAMIAREHRLAKTGIQGVENANGVASLWLNSIAEKEENFEILKGLAIDTNLSNESDPIIVFNRTEMTNPLANFRAGDVAVLSPQAQTDTEDNNAIKNASVLCNQVFKGTIIEINAQKVVFRFRARQFNQSVFLQHEFWNLEPDMFDSSFLAMYRGLFALMATEHYKRDLLLTNVAPAEPTTLPTVKTDLALMTDEQQSIFKKMIAAKDYFLLWGPPGTGKTSIMLRHLAKYLMDETRENVLFLAYTNRAVDEICEAIESNTPSLKSLYLRIGSRYATHPDFHENLLDYKMEGIKKRIELKALVAQTRIFVATVASMQTKTELFALKNFDTIVIDEASQILEPQIVGLLTKVKKFILIGDHRQLPAVVAQSTEASATAHPLLHNIGLTNLRNSFFERVYQRCRANQWHWAYDQLSLQGRMHQEIVDFPSKFFYENNLYILPEGSNAAQVEGLPFSTVAASDSLMQLLAQKRKCFIDTARDFKSKNGKVNVHEAEKIGEIIAAIQQLYAENQLPFTKNTIGVITPYRAQIAQILHVMQERNINQSLITVDTVERYQGGARDIILISLCTNSPNQVQNLISLSSDGIDRKLNVALTRARKHLIVLGNEALLNTAGIYKDLIAWLKA